HILSKRWSTELDVRHCIDVGKVCINLLYLYIPMCSSRIDHFHQRTYSILITTSYLVCISLVCPNIVVNSDEACELSIFDPLCAVKVSWVILPTVLRLV